MLRHHHAYFAISDRCLNYLLIAALAAIACLPTQANAQIHRCDTTDGGTTYTDRACADIGAAERLPRGEGASGRVAGAQMRGCTRSLRDLIFELTTAIDSRDVNRLAGIYNWTGMSSSAGYALLGRLDAIVNRPLVDVVPVIPEPPAPLAPAPVWETSTTSIEPGEAAEAAPPPAATSPSRQPVALRVEQTLANGSTPSRTVFGLRRNMGCWWITL